MNGILLIQTGGTIDSEPYEDPKNPPNNVQTLKGEDSLIQGVLQNMGLLDRVTRYSWIGDQEDRLNKDSKEFSENDISELAEIIKADENESVIITHGTDFMVKNAKILQEIIGQTDKKIIFVGSMVPLSMHGKNNSDAIPALKYAIENIEHAENGINLVGISRFGTQLQFFNPNEVEKDFAKSKENLALTFETKKAFAR
jgi:L-asparaginase/Glu-tRNA(Gln) amidotransferase subunit D